MEDRNRKRLLIITVDGHSIPNVTQLAIIIGVKMPQLYQRIRRNGYTYSATINGFKVEVAEYIAPIL